MNSDFLHRPSRLLVVATGVLLTLIWGTTWAGIRISLEGFPPLKGMVIRFAIASALLLVVTWVSGVRLGRQRHELALWAVQAGLAFGLSYATVYWAEQWVPSGLTSVLFSTLPLFVIVFAYFLLPQERLGTVGLLGMAVGFGGVAVIFSEDLSTLVGDSAVSRAALVLLIAPATTAFSEVVVKRWGQDIHALSLTAVPIGMSAALFAGPAFWLERDRPIVLEPTPVAALIYLAVAGSAIAFTVFFWLLKHVSVTQISLISYGMPVVAVAVGTVFLNEPFTPRIAIGTVLVIAGAVLVMRPSPTDLEEQPARIATK